MRIIYIKITHPNLLKPSRQTGVGTMKFKTLSLIIFACMSLPMTAQSDSGFYGNFPVTVKDYAGDKTDSTSYSGQTARHLLHNALKKLAGKGNGEPNDELKAKMMAYYAGTDEGREILDPKSKDGFAIKQTMVDEISKDKELKGKTYKGAVLGWPGLMTGSEVIEFMIDKASSADGGYDPVTGYDYVQLISKFMMGAVFYNQAVDNYLDERLSAEKNPNDKPYKEGTHYTGKEHIWDEAFGYFGAPAHVASLSGEQAYDIAKLKPEIFDIADHNNDGVVDLKSEMTFAHAYYAAHADRSGKTTYLQDITHLFIEGRELIASADNQALTDEQRGQLMEIAAKIKAKWEQVIAEATFNYAGSVYKDLQKLQIILEANGDIVKAFRTYAKHWGELKGFAMALQTSGKDLGEVSVKLNRLIGFSPVHLDGNQVTGLDGDGEYMTSSKSSLGNYMIHMIKVQKLLGDAFDLKVRKNDVTADLGDLVESVGATEGAETD